MTIVKETSGNTLSVKLEGRLDTITSPDLEQALSDLSGVAHLVLNLRKSPISPAPGSVCFWHCKRRWAVRGIWWCGMWIKW